LVSNCLKHAFPDNRNGEITIELDSSGSKYILIIKDNGVGFPANIDFKYTDSLGLKLVNALTSQLSGEIELISRNCTEFRITFPLNMHTLPAGF
jgi:two-component sensor histidine kinase